MLNFTDSSYVECCLKRLSVEIGARPAGSSSHRAAADFIAQEMRQAGCEVLWQEYPCPDWQALSCQLVIAGREIPANANTHSPSCDVTGQLIPIGSYEELVNLDISGQIAVLHGDITKAGFFPKNFDYFRDEKQDQFMELLLAKEPAVIITVSHYEGLRPALLADSDLLVPSVTVARQEGSRLLQNPGAEARVTIKSSSRISRGANLIGQRSQNSSKKVVLMAHYDTVPGTPGALDNGAGIAALLLLARSLKEIPMENSLELVAFGGEDSWYPGDALYIKEYPPDDVIAAINIDGIGLKNCNTTLAAFACSEPLTNRVMDLANKYGSYVAEPFYESDHGFFWPLGIPTLAFTTSQYIMNLLGVIVHTEHDTLDNLDLEKIEQTVDLVKDIILMLDKEPGLLDK